MVRQELVMSVGIAPEILEPPQKTGEIVVFRAKPLPPDAISIAAEDDPLDNLVTTYFREAGENPLLTWEEEVGLAKKMEKGKLGSLLLSCIEGGAKVENGKLLFKGSAPITMSVVNELGITPYVAIILNEESDPTKRYPSRTVAGLLIIDEDKFVSHLDPSVLKGYEDEGNRARDEVIEANLRLVTSVANDYIGRGLPFADLIQEGNVILVEKTPEFSWWRGNKFSTYIRNWIRAGISRAVDEKARIVRLPVEVQRDYKMLERIALQNLVITGCELGVEELSDRSGLSLERINYVRGLVRFVGSIASLDKPATDESDEPIGGFVKDPTANTEDEVAENMLNDHLRASFIAAGLTDRERIVIAFRFRNKKVWTYEKIGDLIGKSFEIARRAEASALGKLRALKDPMLRVYYDES